MLNFIIKGEFNKILFALRGKGGYIRLLIYTVVPIINNNFGECDIFVPEYSIVRRDVYLLLLLNYLLCQLIHNDHIADFEICTPVLAVMRETMSSDVSMSGLKAFMAARTSATTFQPLRYAVNMYKLTGCIFSP